MYYTSTLVLEGAFRIEQIHVSHKVGPDAFAATVALLTLSSARHGVVFPFRLVLTDPAFAPAVD